MRPLQSRVYPGVERRSISERRDGRDRRNLLRTETTNSDRRLAFYRRKEDEFWLNQSM